ncbi:hypothetical protein F2Q69_00035183 [Brassica cretica]|uniref:Uncharacterized protein n=1 Tax=Brassica cretica TaxID=69181 RepID=A0A8S9SHA0_BRACR|nr:hypothetical protein F2Q69_00035183 [Brassica cretica]
MAGSGDSRAQDPGSHAPLPLALSQPWVILSSGERWRRAQRGHGMRELRRRYLVVHLVEKLRLDEFLEREIGTLDMCICLSRPTNFRDRNSGHYSYMIQ